MARGPGGAPPLTNNKLATSSPSHSLLAINDKSPPQQPLQGEEVSITALLLRLFTEIT
jgi:hypothetical protein